ncbi:MAG: aminodeoxychorismate/anthranilate synthase component II [Desulfobacterales bacterium]
MATLLVIDNYDSFTYNLVQMFMRYDLDILVHRSDKISLSQVCRMKPDYILISPGPRDPAHAGISTALIRSFHDKIPILAVCLGMQCMNEAFGGKTIPSPQPMHGKTSLIHHENKGLFHTCPSPFLGARYHSLIVEHHCSDLVVTATSRDNLIMALSHVQHPLHGVQFHPESFLTEHGFLIVENFLKLGPANG